MWEVAGATEREREAGREARRGEERRGEVRRRRGEAGREMERESGREARRDEKGGGWAHVLKLQDVRKRYQGIFVLFLML